MPRVVWSSSCYGKRRERSLQMEIYVPLVDRQWEGRELIAFSSEQSLAKVGWHILGPSISNLDSIKATGGLENKD